MEAVMWIGLGLVVGTAAGMSIGAMLCAGATQDADDHDLQARRYRAELARLTAELHELRALVSRPSE